MTVRAWSKRSIDAVLSEVDYLKTCPTGDPWAAIRMKARMEDLASIVRELRRVGEGN